MSLAKELAEAHKARRRRLGAEHRSAGFGYVRPAWLVLVEPVAEPVPEAPPEPLPPAWLVRLQAQGRPTFKTIKEAVADEYNTTMVDMCSKSRMAEHIVPRHVAMYLCKVLMGASLTKIAGEFGWRDHTTVMHAVHKVELRMGRDWPHEAEYREKVRGLRARLGGRGE